MIFILFGVLKIHIRILEKMYPKNYSNFVTMYAKEYQVDENLIYAIIKAEILIQKRFLVNLLMD